MASLVIQNDAPVIGSVFLPIPIAYRWEFPTCLVYNSSGSLAIRVDVSFLADVTTGDFIQVLNGSYKGSYKVLSESQDGTYAYFITDGTFGSSDPLSNLFNIDRRQPFELWAGYSSGSGSIIKPYQKIADISIAINPLTALFEIDLSSYLRSYFEIVAPPTGKDYNISLQYNLVYTQAAPTVQTISWELIEDSSPFADANLRMRVNGVDQFFQTTDGSGSFTANSGDTIQVYAFGFSADYNQSATNSITMLVEDSDTTVLTNQTNTITNYAPTIVGEILFTFSVVRDLDYDITVSSTSTP
jgi:hypothetical protein